MNTRLSEMNLPRFPVLKDDEMKMLIAKAQSGDEYARDRLVNCNLRLVFNMVQRFFNRGYESEDLFQIGTIGLIKAIDKFDSSYNVKFSTYAVPMIVGEIRRFLRDDSTIKVSRSYKEISYKVHKCREELTAKLNRDPKISEIAEVLDLKIEDIVTALDAVQSPTSIHETLYQDDGDPIYVLDQLSDEKTSGEQWFDQIILNEVLTSLPIKERQILVLRFLKDKTQNEVAKIVGLSQVQVSRIERQALKAIRERMDTGS
ncbi:RNA polymerase, sigma subunit, RpoX/SigF [Desulfonispora thiosulfatigenes DSM 11270]|uniref:RNA polymerase sigma factor n=1 Tax=Desulfonispora thiosulfatigenes DSM 11270 TaxID=656914 RepID=A0A1W1VP97_DESTI|nr:RNA polymerase sporulation sigma factor SigF [Desulfonispora thiosulfatigenes]SMB95060.1 RNA polymerase, sigma subunit, RpoX/SigF [Desulfonispora thiosulfatigenes DSM 11270]